MRILRSGIALTLWLASIGWAVAQQPAQSSLPAPSVKVGQMAPDFTLKDQNGNQVSLHDFQGKKNVAIAFYVFAFSPT